MSNPFDRPPKRESDDPEFNDGVKFGQDMAYAVGFGGDVCWIHDWHYCGYAMGVRQGFYDTSGVQLCDMAKFAVVELELTDCWCER